MSIITKETFEFELITPDRIVAYGKAAMILMQGELGEFGVLPKHSSMLSKVYPGIVTVIYNKSEYKKLFISSGFADVNETNCSVLVENAIDLDNVSNDELQIELRSLRAKAKGVHLSEKETEELMIEILYAEMKIRAKHTKSKLISA